MTSGHRGQGSRRQRIETSQMLHCLTWTCRIEESATDDWTRKATSSSLMFLNSLLCRAVSVTGSGSIIPMNSFPFRFQETWSVYSKRRKNNKQQATLILTKTSLLLSPALVYTHPTYSLSRIRHPLQSSRIERAP